MPTSLSAETVDDLLRRAIGEVIQGGNENSAKRGETTEIVGAVLELENPRARVSRTEKRRRISGAIAELCWYLRGTNDGATIAYWIPKYEKEFESDGRIHGGYGPRLFGDGTDNQVHNVIACLGRTPEPGAPSSRFSTDTTLHRIRDIAIFRARPRFSSCCEKDA